MAARARGQVLIAHIVLAFVLSFVLLLMVMASVRRSQYESMLLTTRSRLKSFWFVYVQQRLLGVVAVFALALATVWSDFFLPAMFCSSEPVKPFAVVLQMANQQYETDYSIFAAGAVLSIAAVVVVAAVVSGLYSAAFWLWGGPEWKARLRLK
jgi:ABC-type glycerol-3-phosphate transport system permease component